ncbi:aldehyde dehydrogenase family protein [Rhodococcus opacus]|uniref:aldehyde dehydrogenase family protein n=1 Tax=Rhodococcus opacus TaxID=37919 RepID=UPI001C468A57|nr:aldehyde dehydrogenase family protein [Rhodococcus opacus]MBV6756215.1 aldehyde dehydrogenase family protein [Rhodococcus opacus]
MSTSIDHGATLDLSRPNTHLHIGSERLAEGSAGVFEHVNPATGDVDKEIPLAGPREVDRAVETAHEAYKSWRTSQPAHRRNLLLKLADLIEAHGDEFARRGAMDNGTPLAVGTGMVTTSVEWTRYYAGWADKLSSDVTSTITADGEFGYTLRQPYGVIGIIITWNGPLISLAMKIPAALAAGNTVVVKPSELTPFSGELFADLVAEAGFPPGVVNILPGDAAAGASLVSHPKVQKVSFTGGPATARKILAACAEDMKPAVLELGGKSANIVFDDADLDAACGLGTMMAVGLLSGQGCAFPTRMLVQDNIYDDVLARVAAVAGSVVPGDPFAPNIMTGPVVNKAAYERILGVIEQAKADGARLLTGGQALSLGGDNAGGYFIEPTVFADVDPWSDLAQNEVFGPVLAITKFSTEEEAIEIANATRYGLSGYIQTKDLKRGLRVAEAMVTGEVLINGAANLAVNRPFGGLGVSGLGKEGGFAGIDEFLRTKGVAIA